MGEYAVDQMMRDFERATGIKADRADFEDDARPRWLRPKCAKCGRVFRVSQAVVDHMRDKHGIAQEQMP